MKKSTDEYAGEEGQVGVRLLGGHLLGVWDILFRTTAARVTGTESDDAAPAPASWT
jgi:hypothetical protein